MTKTSTALTTALFLAAGTAYAQSTDLTPVDQEALYSGWRATDLLDREILGSDGDTIGTIETVRISPDGRISGAMVQSDDGFLGFDTTYIIVPWDEIEVGPDGAMLSVSVTEDTFESYSPFAEGRPEEPARTFTATQLIDDLVMLNGETGFGVVEDLVFDQSGQLLAVLTAADRVSTELSGLYALPFSGYDDNEFDPVYGTYYLPYTLDEIGTLEPIDPERFGG